MGKKGLFLGIMLLILGIILLSSHIYAQETLKIGVVATNPPYSYPQKKQPGFDDKLAKQLGKRLKQSVKVVKYKNDSTMLASLKKAKIDVAVGIQKNQATSGIKLSQPYLYPPNTLFIRTDGYFKSFEKLQGHYIGILSTNPNAKLLKQLDFKVKSYSDVDKLIKALGSRKISAGWLSDYQYSAYLAQNPQLINQPNLDSEAKKQVLKKISAPQLTASQLCLATYHQARLAKKLNQALQQLQDNNTLANLSYDFFKQDLSKE